MFVINPDPFLLPSFLISPFNLEALKLHSLYKDDGFCDLYLNKRFGENNWLITKNGREGIALALNQTFKKNTNNKVSILTTTQNRYISSCVTSTIEFQASWNRSIEEECSAIFVNHEFGFPFKNMVELTDLEIPIIEDCCTTFFSQDELGKIGNYGKFSVYSFPKFFPVQIGGLLVGNEVGKMGLNSTLSAEEKSFLKSALSHYFKEIDLNLSSRKTVYNYMSEVFAQIGFEPRIEKSDLVFPSAFLFKATNNESIDWVKLKTFCWNHGIQSSVFYGEDAFFIPCHQNLYKTDIDYFAFVINSFKDFN